MVIVDDPRLRLHFKTKDIDEYNRDLHQVGGARDGSLGSKCRIEHGIRFRRRGPENTR